MFDLLVRVACVLIKVKNVFNAKMYKLVIKRRSTVLSLPL
jgi:hypothetical protein